MKKIIFIICCIIFTPKYAVGLEYYVVHADGTAWGDDFVFDRYTFQPESKNGSCVRVELDVAVIGDPRYPYDVKLSVYDSGVDCIPITLYPMHESSTSRDYQGAFNYQVPNSSSTLSGTVLYHVNYPSGKNARMIVSVSITVKCDRHYQSYCPPTLKKTGWSSTPSWSIWNSSFESFVRGSKRA